MTAHAGQLQWSQLWSVTTTLGNVTNEQAAGITGNTNPLQINMYHRAALIQIRVTAQTNLPLAAVRIYGAGSNVGFPPPGTPAECLCETTTAIAVNQGVIRILAGRHRDNAAVNPSPVVDQLQLIPQFLLLEYSTGAAGATPTITFVVEACFIGTVPQDFE